MAWLCARFTDPGAIPQKYPWYVPKDAGFDPEDRSDTLAGLRNPKRILWENDVRKLVGRAPMDCWWQPRYGVWDAEEEKKQHIIEIPEPG